jgi:hypothetical protein
LKTSAQQPEVQSETKIEERVGVTKQNKLRDDNGLFVEGQLHGLVVDFLLDSGSSATLINTEVYYAIPEEERPPLRPSSVKLEGVSGCEIKIEGIADMAITFGTRQTFEIPAIICSMNMDAILGQDFTMNCVKTIDLERMCLVTKSVLIPLFTGGKSCMVCRVTVKESVVIPANSIMNVPVVVSGNKHLAPTMLLEPAPDVVEKKKLLLAPMITTEKEETIAAVINLSDKETKLYPNTYLGPGQSAYDNPRKPTKCCANVKESGSAELPEYLQDLFDKSRVHLTESQTQALKQLLIRYQHCFAKDSCDLSPNRGADFSINTADAQPIRQRPRRQPFGKREAEKAEIDKMLKSNIIEPSNSAWASPVVLITKKDGSVRFCVDYRKLNEVTVKDSYPLPRIDDCLDALAGAKWFGTMDLLSGYWQLGLKTEEDRQKTAFCSSWGLYQFTVLSFGLTNAPSAFTRKMEQCLSGLQWTEAVVFMDDTIVPSTTFEEGLTRLEHVWKRFEAHGLKMKPSKCLFFQREIKFLGHIVAHDGVRTDPDKIQAVQDWPVPKNPKEVRSFLGLCSYYRKIVAGFADIVRPLNRLCDKGAYFCWTEECDKAFRYLKEKMTTSPVLSYPIPGLPFVLDTDASNEAVGAVLS